MANALEILKAGSKRLSLPGETVTTTFYGDFSIADLFGKDAVKDTFENAFNSWKHDYRYLTNLVVTLNHKSWEHDENGNDTLAELYVELFEKASGYASENLKGEELDYYFNVTD